MSGLRKAKVYDWKDSNMEMVGSDEDRATKKASAETEPAWEGAGQEVGLQIWRIVKFKVEHWPKADYGKFYTGDSYIILNTYQEGNSEELLYDVHFWIGSQSTQDEYGTAAYKTVELDTLLDDKPVQHREVEGHESSLFKSYFKTIQYLEGGAESGFRHVVPEEYKPRLFRVYKDGRRLNVVQLSGLQRSLLHSDDVFLLDMGVRIVVWQGDGANPFESNRAKDYADSLAIDRHMKETIKVINEGDRNEHFDNTLEDGDPEEEPEQESDEKTFPKTLIRLTDRQLSDSSGSLKFEKVKEGDIDMSDFDPADVFIFDKGTEVFCWIGDQTSEQENLMAMKYCHNYLKSTNHPLASVVCLKAGTNKSSKAYKSFQTALSA